MNELTLSCLKESEFTLGLDESAINKLHENAKILQYQAGQVIIKENENNHNLYLIMKGEVSIHQESAEEYFSEKLTTLKRGQILGEVSFLDKGKRSAEVIAFTECTIMMLRAEDLTQKKIGTSITTLVKNLAKIACSRLRLTTQRDAKQIKEKLQETTRRVYMGYTMINLIFIMTIYTLFQPLIKRIDQATGGAITSIFMILIICAVLYFLIRRSVLPLSSFGLTLKNYKKIILQAILYTLPLIIIMIPFKYFLIWYIDPSNKSLFALSHSLTYPMSLSYYLITIAVYAIFTFPQEFMVRGCLQSIFHHYLEEKKQGKWMAILLSNLLFSAAHIHKSFFFALLTFIPGLFWGWLYSKQKSLVGVCVSHAILGVYVVFIVGFQYMTQ